MQRKMLYLFLVLTTLLTFGMVEFFHSRNSVLHVSAIEASVNVGVYWDLNCSQRVYSIDWRVLSPGELKGISVFVRNEGNESFLLVLTPINWSPVNASYYLNFSWSCKYNRIEVDEIVNITLILSVSPHIKGISVFSFDIVFEGINHPLADVNCDGIVDGQDYQIVKRAIPSRPGDPNWNPNADINRDGVIDGVDFELVVRDLGEIWNLG